MESNEGIKAISFCSKEVNCGEPREKNADTSFLQS